ncbi:SH3 domain-containing protein [Pseudoalteromonas sp.]|uniref:SH3 domain-containing protein n=1 Tax=Pseudoalteromonas sp. TaxID=53249 RepID=UPI003566A639
MKPITFLLMLILFPLLCIAKTETTFQSKTAIVAMATNLYTEPSIKSDVVASKEAGDTLQIGKRHRAWYFVEEQTQPNAWIKMLAVQLATQPRRSGNLGVVSLIESMNSKPTASTAVRGFDKHAFDNITPNKALLKPIDSFKPNTRDLNVFIENGKLTHAEVPND